MIHRFPSMIISLFILGCLSGQNIGLDLSISVDPALLADFNSSGRLFVFLNKNPSVEPRTLTWPSPGNYIFAKNIADWDGQSSLQVTNSEDWISTASWSLDEIPQDTYYFQVAWDQDTEESRIDAPGNLHSQKQKIELYGSKSMDVVLKEKIPARKLVDHPLVKEVILKSDTLSAWWGKPMFVKASILLPGKYGEQGERVYPIRYNVAGYGGRYTRINRIANNTEFMEWWTSDEAPQIINVFLDGEGPFGDSYQMDSDNSGPYGFSLINELIPHIEDAYRGTDSPLTRFVDGCSTGGWVSLGLQLYYPESFNGVFSYSPDAVEFENYQLINIYRDKNAYTNEFGYERPVARMTDGEPMIKLRDFLQYENVLGTSNTYVNSGGQFSAHNALYSPKGVNGLPQFLIDPVTGNIDSSVAEYWKKYDFKIYTEEHWKTLGPKLQGKIHIWMGDMDHFYLNIATRAFDQFLQSTTNPKSDAEVIFSPTQGHCAQFSNRTVLDQIVERLSEIK